VVVLCAASLTVDLWQNKLNWWS